MLDHAFTDALAWNIRRTRKGCLPQIQQAPAQKVHGGFSSRLLGESRSCDANSVEAPGSRFVPSINPVATPSSAP